MLYHHFNWMKQIEANIREEIKQCQYNVCCMTLAVKEYRKRDNIYNWAVALSSFGSVTAWMINAESALIDAIIIAISQLLFAIKPLFAFSKNVHTLNKHCYTEELLLVELLELWDLVKRKKIDEDYATNSLNALRKRLNENEFFDDDDDFEYSEKLLTKAQQQAAEILITKHKISK